MFLPSHLYTGSGSDQKVSAPTGDRLRNTGQYSIWALTVYGIGTCRFFYSLNTEICLQIRIISL